MKMFKRRGAKVLLITTFVLLIGVAVLYWRTSRAAYETARYTVITADANFEIRDYPGLALAETPMATGDANRNGSFGKLFRFITGANAKQQKISMTTPVFVDPGPSDGSMAFVLPADVAAGTVPEPTDQAVALREFEAGRYAVLRFTGSISEKSQDEAYERLLARMEKLGLKALSGPQFAYYDPPWTIPAWRRNEVLVRIADDAKI